VSDLVFHDDGRLSSASLDGQIAQWNPMTGAKIRTIRSHESVYALATDPAGWRLIAAAADSVTLWDAARSAEPIERAVFNPSLTARVAFFPDGRRIAYPDQLGVTVYDLPTGKTTTYPAIHAIPILALVISPDGKLVATSATDGTAKVLDVETGKVLQSFRTDSEESQALAFSPDGNWLATCGMGEQELRLWNIHDPNSHRGLIEITGGNYRTVAFHPHDKLLVCGGSQEELHVVNPEEPAKVIRTIPGQVVTIHLSFADNGKLMISACADGKVRIWRWPSLEKLYEFDAAGTGFTYSAGCALATKGPRLFVGMGNEIRLFDLNSKLELLSLKQPSTVLDIALSPNGEQLAALCTSELRIFDAGEVTEDDFRRREAESLAAFLARSPISRAAMQTQLAGGQWAIQPAVRELCVQALGDLPDDVGRFNNAAWRIVRSPRRPDEDYKNALRLIEQAIAVSPDDGTYLNTLGVCQFRLGDYEGAIESLEKSRSKNQQPAGMFTMYYHPSDTLFLAMSLYQAGRHEEARQNLKFATQAMKVGQFRADRELREFMTEAQTLLESSPND
jgi:WD40 repeat protein